MQDIILSPITTDNLVEMIAQRTAEIVSKSLSEQSQPTEAAEQFLSIQEAAKFLNLTVPTCYSKVSRGELPCMKRGKRLYFSDLALKEYLKDGRKKSYAEIEAEAQKYFLTKK